MTTSTRLRTFALIFVLALTLATAARASDAKLVGTWKGDMESQMGSVEVTVVIDGAAPLTGKVTLAQFGGPIAEGKVDGEKVSFTVNIEHGTLKFDGTVAGDEMKLTVIGTQGDKMALVAKRQK
jgi:hypothetical protein